jgi:hypothetical protein
LDIVIEYHIILILCYHNCIDEWAVDEIVAERERWVDRGRVEGSDPVRYPIARIPSVPAEPM